MLRTIVEIDEAKCNGCGICIPACHEGAIALIDGKARIVSEIACDGLGACLGECPMGAITLIEREAPAFDQRVADELVAQRKAAATMTPIRVHAAPQGQGHGQGGCPGSRVSVRAIAPKPASASVGAAESMLGHWPVQLALVAPGAPFLQGADLLICADCVPFAMPNFHARLLAGKAVLIGCPKLDDLAFYREKLEAIFRTARPKSLTVARMEVPCCSGIARASEEAWHAVFPERPIDVVVVTTEGQI